MLDSFRRAVAPPRWAWLAAAALVAAGCRGPALTETALSLPAGPTPARLAVKVDEEPLVVRFAPGLLDHVEWREHDPGEAPPNPLLALPPGPTPDAAWVLRVRRRGSSALVPVVYLAVRDAGRDRMLYVSREEAGPREPGTAFEVQDDLSVRVTSPTGPVRAK